MYRLLTIALLAGAAVSLGDFAAAQQDDRAVTKSGRSYLGEVTSVSHDEVVVSTRAGERKIAVNELEKINFGNEPRELRLGRDAALRQAYERAIEDLSKVDPNTIQRPLTRQDLEFYLAWAKAKQGLAGGDKATAVRLLRDFLSKYPDSYHFYEAVRTLGDLAVALDRYDVAVEYYRQLGQAPFEEYKLAAALATATALRVQGKFQEAADAYEKVVNSPLDSPEVARQKQLAKVGQAACLAELGKPEEGVAIIEQVLRENPSEGNAELYARAYNALGDCHRKMNQPKQALLDYLHTDLLFNQDPDAHAEALYHLSVLWKNAGKNSERALRAATLLRSQYSGTRWAKMTSN